MKTGDSFPGPAAAEVEPSSGDLERDRLRLERTNFLEGLGSGGMILQMPKEEASRSMREMNAIGSANSVSVGRYSGARGRFLSQRGISASGILGVEAGVD